MKNGGLAVVSGAVGGVEATLPKNLQSVDRRKGPQQQNGGIRPIVISWQDAEDALFAAFEYLGAMPDRERGYLSAGSRSCWPAIMRDAQLDYAEGQGFGAAPPPPSARLTRRHASLVERMLTGEKPLANAIPEGHRALVGRVAMMKLYPGADGFGWDRVYRALGGKLFNLVRREELPTTSDSMRKAYERAIQRVAQALEAAA